MDDRTRTLNPNAEPAPAQPPIHSWGPFTILERVGQGGFGEVYRAFDPSLQREVALKLLLPRGQTPGDQEQSVLREARQMARVRHPNVVPVYGVDTHDGRAGFWSDFIRGKTLSDVLDAQGPFGAPEAAFIGIEVAKAAGAIHAAGLFHGDIKAGNVMREIGGRIVLMDFGLAQHHQEQSSSRGGGTPLYMAPELLTGGAPSKLTDIYALGVLLFHLLTAKYPVFAGVRHRLIDERPDLPESLASVVETACHEDPARRHQSAGELIAALSQTISAPPSPPVSRRRAWLLAPAALLIAGAALWLRPTAATGGAHAVYLNAQDQLDHYYRPQGVERAIALFEQTIAQDPKFALAHAGLARANFLQYWHLGDPRFVTPTLNAAATALSLDRNLASVHVTLGRLYTETGKNDLAAQELNEAMRLDSTNAEAWHAFAELYQKQGRLTEVEPALRKAIDLAPNDWRFPDALGASLLKNGRLEQALDLHRQAAALTPDNPRALNNLGIAWWRLNRLPEARQAFEAAIRLEPGFNRYNNLGAVLQIQGNFNEATAAYRRAIELNPSSHLAWGNLGLAHYRIPSQQPQSREAYAKAISLAESLRKQKPNDGTLLSTLAMYYAFSGDDARCLPLLRQAAALSPRDPDVLFRAALAHELGGRRPEAVDTMSAALASGLVPQTIDRYPELRALRRDPKFPQQLTHKETTNAAAK